MSHLRNFSASPARRCVVLAGFALLVVCVLALHPTWARSIGADVWNIPGLTEEMRELTEERVQLDAESESLLQRRGVKEAIVADLIAGRLTLAEATDRFMLMDMDRPGHMEARRAKYPGDTDFERTARVVIVYAQSRAAPAGREALQRRLEEELQVMLAGSAAR